MQLRDILLGIFWFEWPRASGRQWLLATGIFSALLVGLYLIFAWFPPTRG